MHEILVLAQPTTEKGSADVKLRLNALHELYQDLMWIKTPQDRENEKKQRIKDSWAQVRGATREMAKAANAPVDKRKKPILKINWEGIHKRRKLYAEKFIPKKEEGG